MKGFYLNGVWAKNMEEAIATLPSELIRDGVFDGASDILSLCCADCEDDEMAFRVANALLKIGYTYRFGCNSTYYVIASEKRWKVFHYLMRISGAYNDSVRLPALIEYLDRKNIDPFLDRGVYPHKILFIGNDYQKFHAFRTAREKARIASIALIGVGKRRNRLYSSALDVMRVISRVVWSERCDEKWSE